MMLGTEKDPRSLPGDKYTPDANEGGESSSSRSDNGLLEVRCSGSTQQNTLSQSSPEDGVVLETPDRSTGSIQKQPPTADKVDINSAVSATVPNTPTESNLQKLAVSAVRDVLLGTWRDSPVHEVNGKHAVTGFIDVRGRLRTRIQPYNIGGEAVTEDHPVPSGPGGSWVTFDNIIFSYHLVGLNQLEVKEYTRLRSDVTPEKNEEDRIHAENAAVKEAKRRVKENPALENSVQLPPIAYGAVMPDQLQAPVRPDLKRRRVSGGFVATNPAPQSIVAHQNRPVINALPGTRPTRILIGYWKPSSEVDVNDRHAVYGILGQNDMFRVKVVRETRDGRFVDGNFPSGAGALWIPYEEVEFEPHLKALNRQEVKEYCRVRQYQLDRGESNADRINNETTAVFDAQFRAGKQNHNVTVSTFIASPQGDGEDRMNGRQGYSGHELRQSRRIKPRPIRAILNENELQASSLQSVEAVERTNALARREIARAEAAQGRADRHAVHRERAAAAAAAAASNMPLEHHHHTNGRMLFHESEDMQRLNKVWARQEVIRMKGGPDDAKIYNSIKYERKATGPFLGKLVSQGTIINIDGEDYVEYRVLTKPSFF